MTIAIVLIAGVMASTYFAVRENRQARISAQTAQDLQLEKAWSLPEQGRIAEGMLWMAHCLESVAPGQKSLDKAIRTT